MAKKDDEKAEGEAEQTYDADGNASVCGLQRVGAAEMMNKIGKREAVGAQIRVKLPC